MVRNNFPNHFGIATSDRAAPISAVTPHLAICHYRVYARNANGSPSMLYPRRPARRSALHVRTSMSEVMIVCPCAVDVFAIPSLRGRFMSGRTVTLSASSMSLSSCKSVRQSASNVSPMTAHLIVCPTEQADDLGPRRILLHDRPVGARKCFDVKSGPQTRLLIHSSKNARAEVTRTRDLINAGAD